MEANAVNVKIRLLIAAILVFLVPTAYLAVTVALTVLVGAIAVWPDEARAATSTPLRSLTVASASLAALAIVVAAYRWTSLAVWLPYHADMLIVIREATRRLLAGHNPYAVYRAYDAPWDMAMPYGPLLWGPYVAAQAFRFDFRLLTIAGELTLPIWCGIAAAVEAMRGRMGSCATYLALTAAILLMLDVQRFTLIGHTPVYWPLFLLFAWTIDRRRWLAAACVLGLLVAARTTMVAMLPVFALTAWRSARPNVTAIVGVCLATIALAMAPFALTDFHAVWNMMVQSYPRIMREAVWPVLARPGLETIGVTEMLVERGLGAWTFAVQLVALAIVYAAAFVTPSHRRPLPWMALALFVFSLTTLYPVHYLYYDVLLLLAADAVSGTLDSGIVPRLLMPWTLSLVAVGMLVVVMLRVAAPAFPRITPGVASRDGELRTGFSGVEHDGARPFSWIVGNDARIALPRSSSAAAVILLDAESPFDANQPPQQMTVVLNGTVISDVTVPAGRQQIRIRAPHGTWWSGFNELHLRFGSTFVPRSAGGSNDDRPLALAISRVIVERP